MKGKAEQKKPLCCGSRNARPQQPGLVCKLAPHLLIGGVFGELLDRSCVKVPECIRSHKHRSVAKQRADEVVLLTLTFVQEASGAHSARVEVWRLDSAGLPLQLPGGGCKAVFSLRLEGIALLTWAQTRSEAFAGRVRSAVIELVRVPVGREAEAISTRAGKEPGGFRGNFPREWIKRVGITGVRCGR